MEAFEYAAPNSVKEAVGLLSSNWGEADVLAGGTDLLSLLKEGVHTPKRVVSLKNVSGLKGVSASRIGATATIAELLGSSSVPAAVRQAAEGITSPQMRAMGTVGGELLQRPRCWYFRNGYGLLGKDAKGKSLAPNGENQYHAILGNKGPAYFVSASSLAPALIALEATVTVGGSERRRRNAAGEAVPDAVERQPEGKHLAAESGVDRHQSSRLVERGARPMKCVSGS